MQLLNSINTNLIDITESFAHNPVQLVMFAVLVVLSLCIGIEFAGSFFSWYVDSIKTNLAARHWAIANGVISKSGYFLDDGMTDPAWDYEVCYTFNVGDKEFGSHRVKATDGSYGVKLYCKYITAKYPPYARVKVYYNPNNPEECCLQKNHALSFVFNLLFWTIVCAITPPLFGVLLIGFVFSTKILILQILFFFVILLPTVVLFMWSQGKDIAYKELSAAGNAVYSYVRNKITRGKKMM